MSRLQTAIRGATGLIAVALLLLLAAPALAQIPLPPDPYPADGWYAQYWNNRDFLGSPIYTRSEQAVDYYWGTGSPVPGVILSDQWAARWTRTVYSPGGALRLLARMDDGMRVYLDGVLLLDGWQEGQERALTVDAPVNAGFHTLRVDYYDASGVALAVVEHENIASGGGNFYPDWRVEFFNNPFLSGAPVVVRDEQYINDDWFAGSPVPAVQDDFFSARYTRMWQGAPGVYRFSLTSDDGSRLYVNDQLLIDNWNVQPLTTRTADFNYNGFPLRLRVEFFENTGGARIIFEQQLLSVGSGGGGSGGGGVFCPPPSGNIATISAGAPVNLRSGPGLTSPVLGQIQVCEQVTLLGTNAAAPDWVYVEDFNRQVGWVARRFLQISPEAGIE